MKTSSNYLKDMVVLFVDDEDGVRESYDTLLNMWCKKAYSASNGKEGLELFKEHSVDIVVTDIRMPVMSGLDMIRQIRKIEEELPVIITTAHQEPELLLDAVELQVDAYIVKPIPKKELKKRLEMIAKVLLFEKEKEKSYDILKKVIESSLEAVLVFDDNSCVSVNKTAMELFGIEGVEDSFVKEIYNRLKNNMDLKDNAAEALMYHKNSNEIPMIVKCVDISIANENLFLFTAVDLSYIKKLEEESKKKDKILFEQLKITALAELLRNIGHQWRQPLSVISTSASAIKLEKEYNTLIDENLLQYVNTIIKETQVLSRIIDQFSSFFNKSEQMEKFFIDEMITKTIDLITNSFENVGISIVKDFEKLELFGFSNELIQVIINIFNNAKDAHIKNNIEDEKYIFIDIKKDEKYGVITIKDNAGGIDPDIMDKIFEPYFTTKHQYLGTGIGLYMSKLILEKEMKGKLEVFNQEFKYNEKEHKGACFVITIPLNY